LIYSRFVQCQAGIKEALEEIGRKPVILNGQCSSSERDAIIKDFNVGTYDIIITNLARGIDLQDCDTCILYTLDPNPQNMVQTFGRLTRDIDVVGKTLYFLISEGREKKLFESVSKVRATASMKFTHVGTNLVLEAISNAGTSYQTLEESANNKKLDTM
jgi:superfamily II DNA/RNA helicase